MQNKNIIYKLVVAIGFVSLIVNPVFVYAQGAPATTTQKTTSTVVQEPPEQAPPELPVYNAGVDKSIQDYLCTPSEPADGHDLERCINRLYRFSVTAGALILVFLIVYAGYIYITGGETAKTKAKTYLTSALTGMAILLGSYILLFFINPTLVIFKSVQPPIFTAGKLPTCEELGFDTNCLVSTHGEGVENVGAGGSMPSGTATACKGGIISTPASLPHSAGATRICKDLADKLAPLKGKTPGIDWILNSSISGTHSSSCHGSGNPNSGNCVDIALNGGRSPSYDKNGGGSTNPKWGDLCKAIASLGGLNFANEASNQAACESLKPYKVEKYTSGPNLHVNYINDSNVGVGGGGGSSSTGSRPNCIAVAGVPGVCGNPGTGKYKDGDWDSAKPELRTAFNKLKQSYPRIKEAQVYRSPEYSAYLRSIWEADALANHGWTDAEVRAHGQYCASKGIQYVTAKDATNPKVKQWVSQNSGHISLASPTTCLSDHGQGIAFDIDGYTASKAFETAARNAGLCHDVAVYTHHGVTSGKDVRHFALANGPGVSCVNYW